MSIRFKFRSSVNFDTVDIDGRGSISVRELRAKILNGKTLGAARQQQHDFDLVFLDADSGQDYKDDNFQIPSGSSVIVKRVPAGTVPSVMVPVETVKDLGMKDSHQKNPVSKPEDEFDDFGADFCPTPVANFPDFDLEFDKNNFWSSEKQDIIGLRLGCQKLESSDLNQALPRASSNQNGNERKNLQEPTVEEQMKMAKLSTANLVALQNTNLPLELKCTLCNTFFKDAVMIPCCQHSFCEKCIHLALTEKRRCPKCFSSKCKVEDLLPNLSLRHAIEHCLESQMLDAGLENAMEKYAPDGESGIQVKRDGSCALTVVQREVEFPESSSASGIGSNQVLMESYNEPLLRRNTPYRRSDNHVSIVGGNGDMRSAIPSHKTKQIDAGGGGNPRHANTERGFDDLAPPADFQGENQPSDIPRVHIHDEGGDRNFLAHGSYKKRGRNCYACGSPDHLMRDCPLASSLHPFQPGTNKSFLLDSYIQQEKFILSITAVILGNGAFHGGVPGYPPPYWNDSMFPFRPCANMYSNPSVMPFNVSVVPVTPFAVPPYITSMGVGLHGPVGNMGIQGMGPSVGNRAERPPYSNLEFQHFEHKKKHSNENLGREKRHEEEDSHGCRRDNKPDKSDQYKSQKEKEHSLSQSEDSFTRRSQRKNQHDKYIDSGIRYIDERLDKSSRSSAALRDKRLHRSERSNSGIEDMSKSSERYSGRRHKDHHEESKHLKKVECDSDSSLGHYPLKKDVIRREVFDARGSHIDRRECEERDSGHDSRHSRHFAKYSRYEQHDDKWQIVSGSNDYKDEYRHKRKRVY
ncbi:E3 ubiquitin ligase PARAQUAT TOLERANCE 3-like isoform X1 [Olea europaea subsp. europaea]|uniref:E3 ubiquitin ligase PARAQUAT TOLERANCE 3-like isoform X1 n=1 Tax=Olea europaea subsp. europaea TaxID=158383 RepID=A0A8S0PDG7_OLEEU|nr:E3 ubiquitin ligase PARAQUAT TOLERANCE 3-like isoform X1 [Olea europaea subsp. europaea]